MKYNALRQLTIDKTFVTLEEAREMQYLEKIPRLFNECLNLIVGSISPNTLEYTFRIRKTDMTKKGIIVTMPSNFNSFSQINDSYLDDHPFIIENYYSNNQVILFGDEIVDYNPFIESNVDYLTYTIFYSAFYPKLTTSGNSVIFDDIEFLPETYITNRNDKAYKPKEVKVDEYNLDDRIAMLLPLYAASGCLMQDDRGLSSQYKNEFELFLARVDITEFTRPRKYRSVRGLY